MIRSRRSRSNRRHLQNALRKDRLLSTIEKREVIREILEIAKKPLLSEGSVILNLIKEFAIDLDRHSKRVCCFMVSTQAQEADQGADVKIVWSLRSPDCQFKAAHPEGGGLKYLLNASQNGRQHPILMTREASNEDVLYVLPLFFTDTHVARGDSKLWAMTVLLRPKQIPTPPNIFKPFWLHLQLDSWTMYVSQGIWKSLPEPIPADWINRVLFPVQQLNIDLARSLPWQLEALTYQPVDLQKPSLSNSASYNQSVIPRGQSELELYTQYRDACAAAFQQNLENLTLNLPFLARYTIAYLMYQGYDYLVKKEKNRLERQNKLGLLTQLRRKKEIRGLWPKFVPFLLKNTPKIPNVG